MKKLIFTSVLALFILTSCAEAQDIPSDHSIADITNAPAVTDVPADTTAPAESELPPYEASVGKPYMPFPDFSGVDITDPFTYEAGKPEVSGESDTFRSIYFCRDGKKIYSELYIPEGDGQFPVVVMSSGQVVSLSRYRDEAKTFAENGIACIISDYIGAVGSSNSDGEITESSVYTEAQDLNVILDSLFELPKIDTDNVFLWGQSIGGLVSTIVGGDRQSELKGMILLEPDYTYPDLTRYRNPDLSRVKDVISEPQFYNTTVGKQFIIDMCAVDALKEISECDKDTLVIFGNAGADKSMYPALSTLYPEAYKIAAETFPSADIVTIDGADHMFQGEYGEKATEKAIEFIKVHIS